ncbi:Short-chain dehydrogenase/reductase family protein [Mycena sanguinolenta]|uniref:Short-chain dehydrogenase/reductase family protein n=1 Tax=Mycena sanguinolenta TaxID=230812 RepID=A0A8H6X9M2_9AGAR|nr:Short-chain dehydrogenase/reductase family protein [Mycena sanguinolenta]
MVRTILVTGANQGLGMHTVHQLGATPDVIVFMGSRKLAAAEDALSKFSADIHSSSAVVPIQLDVTDTTSIQAAHAFVVDFLKTKGIQSLDVIINNAAICVDSFPDSFATNVIGVVSVTDAFRPLLNNSTGGAILNISSALGSLSLYSQHSMRLLPAYASSKAALNMLTVQWAQREREARSGIRVISIYPGFIATNLNNYAGSTSPADGCKVIVKAALETEGGSGVFIHKDGEFPW